jgi:hypothetical protein
MIYDQVRVKEAIRSAGGCCGVNIKHNNNIMAEGDPCCWLGLTHEKALSLPMPHILQSTHCVRCATLIVMGGLKLLAESGVAIYGTEFTVRCVHTKLLGCMYEGFPVLQLLQAENPFGALSLEMMRFSFIAALTLAVFFKYFCLCNASRLFVTAATVFFRNRYCCIYSKESFFF